MLAFYRDDRLGLAADGFLVDARVRTRIENYGACARFTEDGEHRTTPPPDTLVSMKLWGFAPAVYAGLAARFPRFLAASAANIEKAGFFIPDVVADLIRERRARVKVLATQDRWYGVTYAQDTPRVKVALQALVYAGIYPAKLWKHTI